MVAVLKRNGRTERLLKHLYFPPQYSNWTQDCPHNAPLRNPLSNQELKPTLDWTGCWKIFRSMLLRNDAMSIFTSFVQACKKNKTMVIAASDSASLFATLSQDIIPYHIAMFRTSDKMHWILRPVLLVAYNPRYNPRCEDANLYTARM